MANQTELLRKFEKKLKKKMTNSQFVDTCNEFKTNIEAATTNMNSRASRLAKANQMIRRILGEAKYKISLEILKPTREQKIKQIAEQKEIYMARLQNRIKLDFTTYINTIDTYKTSNDYSELVVGVCLISGRRITEIMKTGVFSETNNAQFCLFGGTLKRRRGQTDQPYEIPLIGATGEELVRMVNKLRELKDWSKESNEKVASSAHIFRCNNLIKSLFGVNVTTEVIRGAYAFIAYRMYSNPSVSEILYGSRILGHKVTDLTTFAQNYNKVFLDMNDYSSISSLGKKIDKMISLFQEILKSKV